MHSVENRIKYLQWILEDQNGHSLHANLTSGEGKPFFEQNAQVTGVRPEASHLRAPLTLATRIDMSSVDLRARYILIYGIYLFIAFSWTFSSTFSKNGCREDRFLSSILNCSACLMGSDYKLSWLHKKPTISSTQTRPVRVSARCQAALHYSRA